MSDDKLAVGIIGIGWWGAFVHVPSLRNTERAEVVAISRRNPERLALAARELGITETYTDWREMLEQAPLDAVVVSTPNNAHVEPALAALERGLHVLVEKPMALTSQDAQAMIQAAERADRVLMVGYKCRGMPSWRAVKRVLDGGTIGQVSQINVTCCIDCRAAWQDVTLAESFQAWIQSSEFTRAFVGDVAQFREHWRSDPVQSGGGWFVDVGTHVTDLMLWLAGAAPTQVVAFAQEAGGGIASVIDAQARLSNGATLSFCFNDTVSGGDFGAYGRGRLTAYGDHGLLTADWTGLMGAEAEDIWVEQDGERRKIEPEGDGIGVASAFVASVLDGAPNLAPPDQAARTVAFTEAAYRSADEGRIVRIGR